jgi:benzoyl-CoA reductase/2-hydroxyglutaryl-CoA dehydratase subunit BcrC/BadD/HgdB
MAGNKPKIRAEAAAGCGREMNRTVGITATLPVEAVFAAGLVPADLNNVFINSGEASMLVDFAERSGIPPSVCNWIKGIYAVCVKQKIPRLICVTGGDCTNSVALMELLEHEGFKTHGFSYPYERARSVLEKEIEGLANALGTTTKEAEVWFGRLKPLREKLKRLDSLTWKEQKVTGGENHEWLVSSSDMRGDPGRFERELDGFLKTAEQRKPERDGVRLAYAGVPPIIWGLYEFIEERGGRVALNETQRAFSMPYDADTLADAYLAYTYPYDVFHRIADLKKEIRVREVRGVIHYVQNACHRQIADKILRAECGVPVLTIDADRPGPLSAQHASRIEAFMEILRNK